LLAIKASWLGIAGEHLRVRIPPGNYLLWL
jgi:hypothetical protein